MWHNVSMPARAGVGSMVWIVCTVGCWNSGTWLLTGGCKPEVSGSILGACHQVKPGQLS